MRCVGSNTSVKPPRHVKLQNGGNPISQQSLTLQNSMTVAGFAAHITVLRFATGIFGILLAEVK